MKNQLFVLFLLFFYWACSNSSIDQKVKIVSEKDTVAIGESFIAKIFPLELSTDFPMVYIVQLNDTIPLLFDNNTKCAKFEAVGSSEGVRECNGFVEYLNSKEEKEAIPFNIKFYVISHSRTLGSEITSAK